jgi:hypothetical protein
MGRGQGVLNRSTASSPDIGAARPAPTFSSEIETFYPSDKGNHSYKSHKRENETDKATLTQVAFALQALKIGAASEIVIRIKKDF